MTLVKSLAKDWLPPIILRALRQRRGGGILFEGDYSTWEEAAAECTGYESESILAKVLSATLKVKRGEAVYERDSVFFNEIHYAWPVTASLMWAAAQNAGRLDVLDYGGALGSSYFQNRAFLAGLQQVRWSVVEQAHYVEAGRVHIQDQTLRFYDSVENCYLEGKPNVILLSSVLQYLPKPKLILNSLFDIGAEFLVIDRTPFINSQGSEVIKVQHVPSSIYSATYPCWFFEIKDLIKFIETAGYSKIEIFESLDKLSNLATWQGLIFKKSKSI